MIKDQRGMGPIEKILAGVMIAVIAVVIFAVVNPGGAKAEKRNEERVTDIATLLEATRVSKQKEDLVENEQLVIDDKSGTVQMIVNDADAEIDCRNIRCGLEVMVRENCTVDYSVLPKDILSSVPIDPSREEGDPVTGYYVNELKGVYTFGACNPEPTRNGIIPEIKISSEVVEPPVTQ